MYFLILFSPLESFKTICWQLKLQFILDMLRINTYILYVHRKLGLKSLGNLFSETALFDDNC